MSKHILLVEDDQDFRNILKQYLQMFDYTITCAQDGEAAISLFTQESFDLCVLDVMMPKMDGFSLAEKIIELSPETPFIFLTARKLKEDRIKGLKLGADDYIVKPFEAEELVLRLNNIIKRNTYHSTEKHKESKVAIGKYIFDESSLSLTCEGHLQRLTKKETALLQFLYQRKNTLIKREEVLLAVWGSDDFFSGRSMDVFISRLRKYFKEDERISLTSIRGAGLEFRVINNLS